MWLVEEKSSNIYESIVLTHQLQKQMLVLVSFLQEMGHMLQNKWHEWY